MFRKPNQAGQRKQKEIPPVRKPHPQTTNSNRETILLEPHATPTKQTTEGGSNREKNAVLAIDNFYMFSRSSSCRDPGFVALESRRLLRPRFRQVRGPGSDYKLRFRADRNSKPGTDWVWVVRRGGSDVAKSRSSDAGRDASATWGRDSFQQTRRKRENLPLNFVAIKRRPDRLFS